MKVTRVKFDGVHVNHRGDWVFAKVETDQGVVGIGELRAGTNYTGRVQSLCRLADQLIGTDPAEIESFVKRIVTTNPEGDTLYALSALEQALWDIAGKCAGVAIQEIFASSPSPTVQLYANINRATTDRTPEGFGRNAASAVSDGFDAVKLAPFDGLPNDIDRASDAETGIACVREVRARVGPAVRVLVDCHRRFTVKGALEVADALRDLDLYWFEQPIPENDLEAVAYIRSHCGLRLAGGEGFQRASDFLRLLESGCLDVIMPDLMVVGGVHLLREIAALAVEHETAFSPHGPLGPVCLAASCHAVASSPQFLMMEYAWGEAQWRHDLIQPPEEIHKGRLTLSNRPGLGFELDSKTIAKHRIAVDAGSAGQDT